MNDPNRPVTGYPPPPYGPPPPPYGPGPPPPPYGPGPPPPGYYNPQYYPNQEYYVDPYAQQRAAAFLRCLLGFVIASMIITVAIFFITLLVLHPLIPEFRVDSFSVSKLNVSSSPSTISGDFNVHLTIHNPNEKLSVFYDRFLAGIFYHESQISQNTLPPFWQPTKNETAIQALFTTLNTYVHDDVVGAVNTAKGKGTPVGFDLMMVIRVGFKSDAWSSRQSELKVLCEDLSVGIAANASNGTMSHGPLQCKTGF